MKMSASRLEKLSDIVISIGQVLFASVLIEPLLSGNYDWTRVIFGLILSLISWWLSIFFIKK